jgi:stearoyl-CoA desaturase (delta-9 desaturase)
MRKPTLAVLGGLLVCQIANLCTTVFLHRASAHRAVNLKGPATFGFRWVTWITTGIRPREWVAVHRKHHAFTDVDGDPHSPKLLGWKQVQLTNVGLYRREARNEVTLARYAKDIPRDRWDSALFDKAWLGLSLGISVLIAVFGPFLGLLAAGVHTLTYLMSNAAVNAVGHTFGKRPFENSGTNVRWLALITGGEGWHNNHHAAPTSARIGFGRRQADMGWWFIRALRSLGLAQVRHDRPVLVGERRKDQAAA